MMYHSHTLKSCTPAFTVWFPVSVDTVVTWLSHAAMLCLSAALVWFVYGECSRRELPEATDLASLIGGGALKGIAQQVLPVVELALGTVLGIGFACLALAGRQKSTLARIAMRWSVLQALGTGVAFFLWQ